MRRDEHVSRRGNDGFLPANGDPLQTTMAYLPLPYVRLPARPSHIPEPPCSVDSEDSGSDDT